ncbi:MAG: hypothetical protein JST54_03745 [Deltaproteobacteria bacterium]|nr:hypothetical protein [Deltaproteobacteria bacterium]
MTAAVDAAPAAAPARAHSLARFAPYAAILGLAAPIRLWAAVADQGMFWPDEIYQSLEQGHRVAFGYGLIPWEFEQGARSWLFPGLIGLLWKLAAALGVHGALTLIVIAKVAVVIVGLAGIAASMRLAEKLAGTSGALLAGALSASFPAMVVFGARCMTETVSGPLIVGAAVLLLEPGTKRARIAAALAATAVFFRYQNGVVVVGLLALLFAQKRRQDAIQFAIVAAIVGLLGGVLDWVTWGRPFHAFITYVQFNLIEGKASKWGTSPFGYYLQTAWTSTGPSALLIPLGLAAIWTRARGYVVVVLAYWLAHSVIPHKEFRFLLPIVPFAMGLAGAGLGQIYEQLKLPRWPATLLAAAFFIMGYTASLGATMAELGQDVNGPGGQRSVWHADEATSRLLLQVGARDDLCGVVVTGQGPAWTGGYTYLHRGVPYFFRMGQMELSGANYIIALDVQRVPDAYVQVGRYERFVLYRRDGGCQPPPAGWRPTFP